MGTMDDRKLAKRDAKRAASEQRLRRKVDAAGVTADWVNADAQMLLYAVAAIAARGGALRLGYTRDGGAYAIGVYGDGDPFTEYVRPSEDINVYLRGIIEDYSA